MTLFEWDIRVYYEDTDAAGVVYYANYAKFMERARTEWLRALGVNQRELLAQSGIQFVVRQLQLRLRQPARFNDALQVVTAIKNLRPMRVLFQQQVMRDGVVLAEGEIEVVCVDAATFKPVMFPEWIQNKLHGNFE